MSKDQEASSKTDEHQTQVAELKSQIKQQQK